MTRYFCDICKKELKSIEEMVCINFNHFGVLHEVADEEIQVCQACANRTFSAIHSLSPKEET